MPATRNRGMSRRSFMKLSGAATAAAAASNPSRILHALVSSEADAAAGKVREVFSACDMCFNKCGLIARVEDGVVKKLDPNPHSLKSRGMLCARGNAGIRQLYDPDRLASARYQLGGRRG